MENYSIEVEGQNLENLHSIALLYGCSDQETLQAFVDSFLPVAPKLMKLLPSLQKKGLIKNGRFK